MIVEFSLINSSTVLKCGSQLL